MHCLNDFLPLIELSSLTLLVVLLLMKSGPIFKSDVINKPFFFSSSYLVKTLPINEMSDDSQR